MDTYYMLLSAWMFGSMILSKFGSLKRNVHFVVIRISFGSISSIYDTVKTELPCKI